MYEATETTTTTEPIPVPLGPSNDSMPHDEYEYAEHLADMATRALEFEAMDPVERRILIARDVLLWLENGKITAESGLYVHPDDEVDDVVNGYTCRACALGGILACAVERGGAGGSVREREPMVMNPGSPVRLFAGDDKLGTGHWVEYESGIGEWSPRGFTTNSIRETLSPYFAPAQLNMIEAAFEGEGGYPFGCGGLSRAELRPALRYHNRVGGPLVGTPRMTRLMRAIMRNIVRNGGTFVP